MTNWTPMTEWLGEYLDLQQRNEAAVEGWVELRRELASLLEEIEREAAAHAAQAGDGEDETR
ncbi:hypothetical protein ACWEIJ_21130 [Lentzea sp. NPDC004789]